MQAFNRAGDTMTPAIVNSFGFWRFEIALAYGLAIALRMGSNRAFFAIAIAESTMALAGAILFKPGRWEKKTKEAKD
jgi:Na+-driven multidrug efflux pump